MDKMCENCGCFFDKPKLIVTHLYNHQARPHNVYKKLEHFKEVLGQFQGKEGKQIPGGISERITIEIPERKDANAADVQKTFYKLNSPSTLNK